MKRLFLALPLLSLPAFAQEVSPTEITFTATSPTRDYGLFLVAGVGEGDCSLTRYLVLGDGVEAISPPMASGESTVLPLGHGFALGDHALSLSAVGCALPPVATRLVILNQSSPSHSRAPQVRATLTAGK